MSIRRKIFGWVTRAARATLRLRAEDESERVWQRLGSMGWAGVQTASGESVTPQSAMGLSVYSACISGIAEDIASLPFSVVRALMPRGREQLRDDDVTRLLADEMNPEVAAFTGKETLQSWCDGWGNGYAEIQRAGTKLVAMWPIHPSRVMVKRDDKTRRPYYWVRADDLSSRLPWVRIEPADMFHLRGLGDGLEGASVLSYRAESIGLALAAQTFAGSMFKNDLAQTMSFAPAAALDKEEFDDLLLALKEAYAGVRKAGGILATNEAGKFERMTINPDEAQALESRQFAIPDVCRWFRRSPSKVGFTAQAKGWATREDEQADDVQQCLLPRIVRWETEIRRKLLGFSSGRDAKFFLQGLLRANSETRSKVYASRISNGTLTPNEVREHEDENPLDDDNADSLLVNSSLVPLRDAGKKPASPPPPPPPPTDEPPAETQPADDLPPDDPSVAVAELEDVLLDAAMRVVTKELAAVTRAMTKDDPTFGEWAERFYASQRQYAAAAFRPAARALARRRRTDGAEAVAAVDGWADTLWTDAIARTREAYQGDAVSLARALAADAGVSISAVSTLQAV